MRAEVCVDHLLPQIKTRLRRTHIAARVDAGVVVEHVDAAEPLGGQANRRLRLCCIDEIGGARDCSAAARDDMRRKPVELVAGEAGQHARRALAREDERYGGTLPSAGTGDQNNLVS